MHQILTLVRDHYPLAEIIFALCLGVAALAISKLGRLRLLPKRFSISKTRAVVLCAAVPIAIRLLLLPLQPPPVPQVHDEFSYLLAAQTFATGHISNPTPPLLEHFETFHENMSPTYHSVYPPAQSAWLATGVLLFGSAWAGVCLSVAALCGAICWALFGCLPRNYAFFAGMTVAIRVGVHSYWVDSFCGGAVAGLAGALLLGGALRFIKKPRLTNALTISAGLALLATSRPYEGLAFAVPTGIACVFSVARRRGRWREALPAIGTVFAGCVLLVSFLGFYNYRCTGSVLLHPHQVNREHYHQFGAFLWSSPNPSIRYSNAQMETFYRELRESTELSLSSPRTIVAFEIDKVKAADFFYIFPFLPFFIFGLVMALKRPKQRLLAFTALSTFVASLFVAWSHPHYIAPTLVSIIGILVQSIREIRGFRRGSAFGHNLSVLLAVAMICYGLLVVAGVSVKEDSGVWGRERADIQSMLEHAPGQQLVFVQYHDYDPATRYEWVYNGPDVRQEKIVWARSLSREADAALVKLLAPSGEWTLTANPDHSTIRPGLPSRH
jgi:hypothetical protein